MICEWCGYEFMDELGRYGCPNCLGEGLDVKSKDPTTPPSGGSRRNDMNTQQLIDKARQSHPVLGRGNHWLQFASHGQIEVELFVYGEHTAPSKVITYFHQGSERITRAEAEKILTEERHESV